MSGSRILPVLLSMAAGLVFMAPYSVQAQGAQGGQACAPGQRFQNPMAIYQACGATQDQLGKIQQLAQAFGDQQKARAEKVWGMMKDMHKLSLQPMPDQNAVMAKQNEINNASAEMANEKTKLMLSIRAVLNPDQQQKLVTMMQQAAQQQMSQGGPGGAGGGPMGGAPGSGGN